MKAHRHSESGESIFNHGSPPPYVNSPSNTNLCWINKQMAPQWISCWTLGHRQAGNLVIFETAERHGNAEAGARSEDGEEETEIRTKTSAGGPERCRFQAPPPAGATLPWVQRRKTNKRVVVLTGNNHSKCWSGVQDQDQDSSWVQFKALHSS